MWVLCWMRLGVLTAGGRAKSRGEHRLGPAHLGQGQMPGRRSDGPCSTAVDAHAESGRGLASAAHQWRIQQYVPAPLGVHQGVAYHMLEAPTVQLKRAVKGTLVCLT